jgi:hypothetical protein
MDDTSTRQTKERRATLANILTGPCEICVCRKDSVT